MGLDSIPEEISLLCSEKWVELLGWAAARRGWLWFREGGWGEPRERDTGQGSKEKQGRGARIGGSQPRCRRLSRSSLEEAVRKAHWFGQSNARFCIGSYVKLPASLWFSRS